MKKLLFVFVVLLPVIVFARIKSKTLPARKSVVAKIGTGRIDSLEKMIPKYLDDSNKVALYDDIGKEFFPVNPDSAIKFENMALSLAVKLNDKLYIAEAKKHLGEGCVAKKDAKAALAYFAGAIETYEDLRLPLRVAGVYEDIADMYSLLGNHAAAIAYFNKAQALYEKAGLDKQSARVVLAIAWVYFKEGDYPKSLEYNNIALKIYIRTRDTLGIASAYLALGCDYNYIDSFSNAIEFETKSLKLYTHEGNKKGIVKSLINLGDIYDREKNYVKALDYDNVTMKIALEANDTEDVAVLYGNIGSINLAIFKSGKRVKMKGDTARSHGNNLGIAILDLTKAAAYSKKNRQPELLINYLDDLSQAYTLSGNYQVALAYHKEYTKVKDSVFSQKNERELAKMQLQFDFDKKEAIAREELKLQRVVICSAVAGLCILLASLFVVSRSLKAQRKLNTKIAELINEREKTIEIRTAELRVANLKLVEMIQYNAHNIREPLTRIMGVLNMREYVSDAEYSEYYLPMMNKAANDLDNTIKTTILDLEEAISDKT